MESEWRRLALPASEGSLWLDTSARKLRKQIPQGPLQDWLVGDIEQRHLVWSRLRHLGLPAPRLLGRTQKALVLEQTWIPGQSFAEWRGNSEQTRTLLRSALRELRLVWRAGIVHGDISPSNLIAGANGRAHWIDWTMAAPFGACIPRSTHAYAAPTTLAGRPCGWRAELTAFRKLSQAVLADAPSAP